MRQLRCLRVACSDLHPGPIVCLCGGAASAPRGSSMFLQPFVLQLCRLGRVVFSYI